MANSNITIKISADVAQALGGVENVKQKLEQLSRSTTTASDRFAKFTLALSTARLALDSISRVFSTVAGAVNSCVEAYTAQEAAETRLQTTLKATQQACGMSATELLNLAESISRVTAYSDQEIMAVEQMLAATRKIGRDVVPRATRAILDMAAATGDDAAGAAHDLAQALSDPAGEIESLKEKGIQLTEAQAENIKKVQEQNGLYQAQQLLLDEVEETYGGMAEAIAGIDSGKLTQISNIWTDIKEGLGEGLLNSIGPALDSLYEKLLAIEDWTDRFASRGTIRDIVRRGDLDQLEEFSDRELQDAADAASRQARGMSGAPRTELLGIVDAIEAELDRRDPTRVQPQVESWDSVYSILSSGNTSLGSVSNEGLERIMYASEYGAYMSRMLPDADRKTYEQRGLMNGIFTEADRAAYQAAQAELDRRRFSSSSAVQGLQTEKAWFRAQGSTGPYTGSGSGVASSGMPSPSSAVTSAIPSAAQSFITANSSLSVSAQTEALNEKIWTSMQLSRDPGLSDEMKTQLEEITAALIEQRNALMEVEDATDSLTDRQQSAMKALESFESAQKYIEPIMSITTSIGDLFQNMADSASSALDEIEAKWDEYFDELDAKQERQSDSLNALLGAGKISYEDYISAQNAMDEERAEAERQKAEEEAEARDKANQYGEAAFAANQANAIAQVAIDTASAIMGAWADNPNPVVAGVMTGLITAASAAQIAAISSQQYTPLAAGGIVQSPTFALLGEGGNKEAVIPLTDSNMERAGFSRSQEGTIVINISVGASYTGDQLAKDVFRGIEMAQRTGALPKWKYA